MRSTFAVVMIAMLVAAPGGVSAQSVAEGSRVRVKTANSKSVGTLTEKTEQQLTLRLENGSEIRVPWAKVERLDMSLGEKGNLGKGTLIGIGAGLLFGLAAVKPDCDDTFGHDFFEDDFCSFGAFVVFPLLGAAGGALVGAFIKTERWKEVDSGPQITLTVPKRGIGAQVKVGW